LWEVLLRSSPHLLILGPAGSGKTALLKWLALQFAQGKAPADVVERFNLKQPVPIFVDLPDFAASGQTLFEFIVNRLSDRQFPYSEAFAEGFLENQLQAGRCILLFDGLDRVTPEVAESIIGFVEQYKDNLALVTSRPTGPQALGDFTPFSLLGFDDSEQEAFLEKWFSENSERVDRLLAVLERNPRMRDLAATPFFLAMLAVAFERKGAWPVSCAALLGEVAEILLAEGADPEVRPRFEAQDKRRVLQELASRLHDRREQAISGDGLVSLITTLTGQPAQNLIDELEGTGLLRRRADGAYEFADQIWREFLVAQAIMAQGEGDVLLEHVDDPGWREVLVLAAGLQENGVEFAATVRAKSRNPNAALVLAGRCLAETREIDAETRTRVLGELLEVFAKDEPSLWSEAAAAVAGIRNARVQKVFTGLLEDADPATRAKACQALGCVAAEWAVMPLAARLDVDKDWRVREKAVWALGQIADPRAIPSLARVLRDETRAVALAAAEALGAIGGDTTIEELIKALKDEKRREGAVIALSRIGASAVPRLIKALRDTNVEVCSAVVEALVRIGPPALEPLSTALKEPLVAISLAQKKWVIEALRRIGEPAVQVLSEVAMTGEGEVQVSAVRALGGILSPKALTKLIAVLGHESERVGEQTVEALHMMASEQMMQQQVVEALIEALPGPEKTSRRAKEALRKIGGLAVEPLIKALKHQDENVRSQVVEVLKYVGDDRAVGPLLAIWVDESEARGIRIKTAEALGALRDEKILEPIKGVLGETLDPKLIKLLGPIKTEGTRRILEDLSKHERQDIRIAAAETLGEYYGENPLRIYHVWKSNIEESLLEWGMIGADDLTGVPETLRTTVLEIYVQDNPEMNLARERRAGTLVIRFRTDDFPRIRRFTENWRLAANNLSETLVSRNAFRIAIEQLINLLCEITASTKLEFEQEGLFYLFTIDASHATSDTKIPHRLPVVFEQRQELHEADIEPLRKLLEHQFSPESPKTALLVLFCESEGLNRVRQLLDRTLASAHAFSLILLGREDFKQLVTAKEPQKILRAIIFKQIDLTIVSPFMINEPVPDNMFFGRDHEIKTIMQSIPSASVALVGGRRVGKTSMLKKVERLLNQPVSSFLPYYVDVENVTNYNELFKILKWKWPEEVGEIDPEPLNFTTVAMRLRRDKPIIFLLDEVDALLHFDISQGEIDISKSEKLFRTFRALANEGLCRFVFSGAKVLNERLSQPSDSPVFNLCGQPLVLGYLARESAEQLVTKPLERMNIELQGQQEIVGTILDISSCHPRLVQYICRRLIETINRERIRYISLRHLHQVIQTSEFKEEYINTIWGQTTPLERIITLVMGDEPLTREELQRELEKRDIPYTYSALDEALRTLVLYSILKRDNDHYAFVPKHFPRIVREVKRDINAEVNEQRRRLR